MIVARLSKQSELLLAFLPKRRQAWFEAVLVLLEQRPLRLPHTCHLEEAVLSIIAALVIAPQQFDSEPNTRRGVQCLNPLCGYAT